MKSSYHTKLQPETNEFCEDMSKLFSEIERKLYVDLKKSQNTNQLIKEYQKKYQINSRHLDSIIVFLQGKIESRKETLKLQKQNLKIQTTKITKIVKELKIKLKKEKENKKILKFKLHQKKRKLHNKQEKLKNLKETIIFGTKKLWKKQFNTEDHEQWKNEWNKARSSEFCSIGRGRESFGNCNCQLINEKLQIRVPQALNHKYGKYFIINDVKFPYGQENINYAIYNNQPITYRFKRKNDIWYLHAIVDLPKVEKISNEENGAIGVDFNPNVVGITGCDNQGNLTFTKQFNYNTQTKEQTKNKLGEICKEIIDKAIELKVPIIIENLDFAKKKIELKGKLARMLNSFAFTLFRNLLEARAYKHGIQVIKINPAYSSIIGLAKFMSMYGLSSDTAAAFVLARRLYRFSERIPTKYALDLPEDRSKHVWSYWNTLNKKKFKLMKRHDFFTRGTNSPAKVNSLDESIKLFLIDGFDEKSLKNDVLAYK